MTPTLATACTALPPEGANFPWGGPAENCSVGSTIKLWLVRHAQPLVEAGVCYGRLDLAADVAATAECARQLADVLPSGIRVVASPLQRCEQLAHALQALRPDLACEIDARLAEMDFGCWEGRAWNDIDRAELQAWTDDFACYAAGQDGESVTGFMARVASVFDELTRGTLTPALSRGEREKEGGSDTLWITHAGVIGSVRLLAKGLRTIERADKWPQDGLNYGQWRVLDLRAG